MTITENAPRRAAASGTDGRVVGIAGPVIDVEFPRGALPEINTALEFDIIVDGETDRRCSPRSPSSSARAASGPSA